MNKRNNLLKWEMITVFITVAPIILGIIFYQQLPQSMAIHFGVNNKPNGYFNKDFVLFIVPILMGVLQSIILLSYHLSISSTKAGVGRLQPVLFAIIPLASIILNLTILGYNLGAQLDIRRIVFFFFAIIMIALGNYTPTVPMKNKKENSGFWLETSRKLGYIMVIGGFLTLFSLFFAWWFSVVTILFIITIAFCYSLIRTRKVKNEYRR